ncbi:MAG: glycine cleavage system protein GcvH [Armatimonadota bacterium]
MVSKIDPQARYAKSHEWVRVEGDTAVVGVSDYAQHQLSDVVYVELPEVGGEVKQGEELGATESVKATEDVYAPVSGTVTEINTELTDHPEWVNADPYGQGWLVKMTITNPAELDTLMDAAAYEAYLATLK